MNSELHLIAALLKNKGEEQKTVFSKLLDKSHLFTTQDAKLNDIIEHYKKYQVFPSVTQFETKYELKLPEPEDALEFYLDNVANNFLFAKMASVYDELGAKLREGNQREALDKLQGEILSINENFSVGEEIEYSKSANDRISDYEIMQANPGIRGVRSGFPLLDKYTCGFSKGDFSIILSKAKSFKTWILLKMALNAYLDGKKVLFYTREITAQQCFRRVDAMLTQFPYRKIRYGFDSQEEFQEFVDKLKAKTSEKRLGSFDIFDVSGTQNKNELDYIHSKITIDKPDILFVDGVYLIQGGKGVAEWERIKNTTNRLKQMAITLKMPVIGTTQATRSAKHGSIEMEDVGGSISFAQDCDYMFSINRTVDPITERLSDEVIFRAVASRDGGDFESKIVLDFDTMDFNEYGICSDEEIDFGHTVDTNMPF